jgi:hypothetical protein
MSEPSLPPRRRPLPSRPSATPPPPRPAAADINTVAGLQAITAQQYVDRGRADGRLLEKHAQQDLMRDLIAACPGKPELAINGFLTGQSPANGQARLRRRAGGRAARQHPHRADGARRTPARWRWRRPAATPASRWASTPAATPARSSSPRHPARDAGQDGVGQQLQQLPPLRRDREAVLLARVNQLSGAVRVLSR